jgi:hypothetical protein
MSRWRRRSVWAAPRRRSSTGNLLPPGNINSRTSTIP